VKLVYTHPNGVVVAQARTDLEQAGIDCVLRNEYASGAMGELAPIDTWPELWVVDDVQWERAQAIVDQAPKGDPDREWRCRSCGSSSPMTFDCCWHCGTPRQSPEP